jgi:predicted metal-dependent enzyme (double-stranded beta helix superfamily)
MKLAEFSREIEEIIAAADGEGDKLIAAARGAVSRLTATPDCLRESLEKLLFDRDYLNSQTNSIWPNEFSLAHGKNGSFTALAYVWEPGSVDTVHDHGSWGVVGGVLGRFEEHKYRRLDDGAREGHAELAESARLVVGQGETTSVLPLDKGLHRLDNPWDELAVSINVYGKAAPRGYVRLFDLEENTVRRAWPPRNRKRLTAIRVLGALSEPWAGDILDSARRLPLPDPIRLECERALARRRGDGQTR